MYRKDVPEGAIEYFTLVYKGREDDQSIYATQNYGTQWSPPGSVPNASTVPPGATVPVSTDTFPYAFSLGGIAWKGTGTDYQRILYMIDGTLVDANQPKAYTSTSPCMGYANPPVGGTFGATVMAWKGGITSGSGDDQTIQYSYTGMGGGWTDPQAVPFPTAYTDTTPSLAYLPEGTGDRATRMVLAWKELADDQRILYSVSPDITNPNNWTDPIPVPVASTNTSPCLMQNGYGLAYGNFVWLVIAWKELADDQISYSYTSDLSNWTVPQAVTGAHTDTSPCLINYGGETVMAWKEAGSDQIMFNSTLDITNQHNWTDPQPVPSAFTNTSPSLYTTVTLSHFAQNDLQIRTHTTQV
jgi:hypothetical protein